MIYEVTCTLQSDGISGQPNDDIHLVSTLYDSHYTINSVDVDDSGNAKLPTKTDVLLKARNIHNEYKSYIEIKNLDNTDTITISNCVANPQ